jgi:hypothetical protein
MAHADAIAAVNLAARRLIGASLHRDPVAMAGETFQFSDLGGESLETSPLESWSLLPPRSDKVIVEPFLSTANP